MSGTDSDAPSRRDLFAGLAVASVALAGAAPSADTALIGDGRSEVLLGKRRMAVVDLAHALTAEFNWMPARPRVAMDPIIGSGLAVGMNLNRLMLVELTGTHVDVPRHFANLRARPVQGVRRRNARRAAAGDAICEAAKTIARTVSAAAIVCFTSSGSTARRIARERRSWC